MTQLTPETYYLARMKKLHAADAAICGYTNVMVRTVDTDVVVSAARDQEIKMPIYFLIQALD